MDPVLFLVGGAILVVFVTIYWLASRYRRCPSDRILVVYGRVGGSGGGGGGGMAARCFHGGGAFVWPVIQDYSYLDLGPMAIDIKLTGALSQQNIRIDVPSTFTVGISTEAGVMENAAERLLGMQKPHIQELAKDIIFGQMRVVIATMPIEEINADRDKLVANISNGVEVELKKVGLRLINVNVQDITDESGYIEALGKEAAARAINDAKIKVAQKDRDGEIGKAEADREKRVRVAAASAIAIEGENEAAVKVAKSAASRREREAEAQRQGSAAEKVNAAQALQEAYVAEEQAERQRAKKEEAAQNATVVVHAEIERRKIGVMAEAEKARVETAAAAEKRRIELMAEAEKRRIELIAEAEAGRTRMTKQGEADGALAVMTAEAEGLRAQLSKKADGFRDILAASGGAEQAMRLLVTEQLPQLVAEQVKAIANLKIGNVTVWDGGTGGNGKTGTADFISGLVGSLPPLHQLAGNVGIELPRFLGRRAPPTAQAEVADDDATFQRHQRAFAEVLEWMRQNAKHLTTFDTDKDGKLSLRDLTAAASTALDWARRAIDPAATWFSGGGDGAQGPSAWAEIVAQAAKDPALMINLGDSSHWLPFAGVKQAVERL